jgi:hypothetical protein
MQSVHSLFLRSRFLGRKPAALPRMTATPNWRPENQASPQVLCLRPACLLSADNADALVAAVAARVRAAVPAPYSVVLDLSATPILHDDVTAAIHLLGSLLRASHANLRLVLPAAQAHATFVSDSARAAMDPDTVHLTARAAMLAAYASLPGAALVTPALRQLLAEPPEYLPLPDDSHRNNAG